MLPDSDVLNWIIFPAGNCVKYVADETVNASILHKSITNLANMKPLLLIAQQQLLEHKQDDTSLKFLLKENEFLEKEAKNIINSNFHSINSHGLIGLWCAVETAVEDTIVLILMNDINALEAIKNAGYNIKGNIKSPLNEIEARNYYSRKLEKQTRNDVTVGEGYCILLSIFGLNISLDKKTLNVLSEINDVRNCLLHRGGIIDEKISNSSIELTKFIGKEINICNNLYLKYYDAVGKFSSALLGATANSSYVKTIKPT